MSAGADRSRATHSKVPYLIAHRGASAYAPEHTLAAYRLGIEQGADFIEPDLQVTRDGHLVCLHDLTLERTTDVRRLFPDRYREEPGEDGGAVRRWYAADFTLAEIRRLDAGRWFDPRFQGARVPTLSEAIDLARGRAGLVPETKAPEVYRREGHDMERLLVRLLDRHGLLEPGADPDTPVLLQSFSEASLRVLGDDLGVRLPRLFLVSAEPAAGADAAVASTRLSPEGLAEVAAFAEGIGPDKSLLVERPEIVRWAHEAGLDVVPWTFRSGDTGTFPEVEAEMTYVLRELGVDGLFTNHPDRFPRSADDASPG